ncbi:sugar transferase [Nesterenkonia sandarakina]|uniref:sugar transferase n=1 Tax=Nesterenkonia sandarakina TaxID=272918 RepID=UPI0021590EF1|nr:sugar transferase [Nesterenkonia sandarakina]
MSIGLNLPEAPDSDHKLGPRPNLELKNSHPEESKWESWRRSFANRLAFSDSVVVIAVVVGVQVAWVSLGSEAEFSLPAAGEGRINYLLVSLVIVGLWLAMLWMTGSRNSRVIGSGWLEYRIIADSGIKLFAGFATLAFLLNLNLARGYLLLIFPIGIMALLVERWVWRRWLHRRRRNGQHCRRVLLMGSPASVEHIAQELGRQQWAGYKVVGVCLSRTQVGIKTEIAGIPVVGDFSTARVAMKRIAADTVIVTSSDDLDPRRVKELSWELEQDKYSLIMAPSLTDVSGPRIHSRPVSGLPLLHVETPQYTGLRMVMKRSFDVVGSLSIIAGLALPMLIIALLVKATSPGPLLYRSRRIGQRGEPFDMLKFRSMRVGADRELQALLEAQGTAEEPLFKVQNDPRITSIGRFLRKYSLDELPQLFNVLVGSMSLIGPRPQVAAEVALYTDAHHRRLIMRPGVTGLWQVSGRSELEWEQAVRLDLYYIENWSLTGDIGILFRTFKAVVFPGGSAH